METSRRPYLKSLGHRGTIEGVTVSVGQSDLCHYFGGVRYALPPPERWRRARRLPSDYTYGSKTDPGRCTGGAGVCPQPGFMTQANPTEKDWTEDCFQCNVYVPTEEAPQDGWPVFVFIHGGWLQFGSPNGFNVAALLGETEFKAVVVMPAYRVNVFGFLYSAELEQDAASVGETTGNHGFWDQRLALEWTKDNIHLFGGDAEKITISGYSAGANSVFHQLAYDLRQPDKKAIVRQAIMFSNSSAVQPKYPAETQHQFDELLTALDIPLQLSAKDKTMGLHQFRPTTDGGFVLPTLFESLDTGEFAKRILDRNIRLIIGECRDEHYLYSIWFPPKENTLPALRKRLIADYPERIVDVIIPLHYPDGKLPADRENWVPDAWGKIYADMQVHHMQRGLIHALTTNSTGVDVSHLIYRYRIEFRAKCTDESLPVEWGVTHSSDYPLWFWGNGKLLTDGEKTITRNAFTRPLGRFVRIEDDFGWGTSGKSTVRTIKPDGTYRIENDPLWETGVRAWKTTRSVDTYRSKI
ncbi:Carboxylesterase type B [Penicillium chermesinum]|nr:Carboxylesterase type B [Penicillium chermesinum]